MRSIFRKLSGHGARAFFSPPPDVQAAARVFDAGDCVAGAIVFLLSLALYVWTLAPSVTLLDSGEFLVAGQHFGVPHPSGYPLWTILAWLISQLPLGNAAWEINLLSALFGALAVGFAATLARSFLRWLFPDIHALVRGLASICAVSAALLFAFSFSMWSQAVITEVYTLHALLMACFLASLYVWIRRPERERGLFASFFFLTLAFSNHQLALAFAPLPFLAVLGVRRRIFLPLVVGGVVTAALFYLLMAWLSADPLVMKASIRFGLLAGIGAALYFLWQKGAGARFLLVLPLAVTLGLLPYAYLPLASSTNPPMNWAYARELKGLFNSFNRSQYPNSLTEQSLRVVGKLMGVPSHADLTPPPPRNPLQPPERTSAEVLREWVPFFGAQLLRSFTNAAALAWLAALLLCLRWRNAPRWVWLCLLNAAFLLSALLEPFVNKASTDLAGWWVEMPYHTATNLLFALLCAAGFFHLGGAICLAQPRLRPMLALLLLLPLAPLSRNYAECSQRGRWFGWEYGHGMLKDLPRGSVMVGGSDQGRFVPTYMIFGESPQAARYKRDPAFDRRDLYILTQNALGEPSYMKYLRDQYTAARPPVRNAFERWLGRDSAYPSEPLVLPTDAEVKEAIQAAAMPDPATGKPLEGDLSILPYSAVLHWIWERNKDWHDFFIEESFPITWTYDYAIPWGFTYKVNPTKLDFISREDVDRDFAFWGREVKRLMGDPLFLDDIDARRSFARLRATIGNIYLHRGMHAEAERAYKESLELNPADLQTVQALILAQAARGEYAEPIAACERAIQADPRNRCLRAVLEAARQSGAMREKIAALNERLARRPGDKNARKQLIILHGRIRDLRTAEFYLDGGFQMFANDPDFLRFAAAHYELTGQPLNSLGPALRLVEIEPRNPANLFILAHALYAHNRMDDFYETMRRAIDLGGVAYREMFAGDDYFQRLYADERFRNLLEVKPSASSPIGNSLPK